MNHTRISRLVLLAAFVVAAALAASAQQNMTVDIPFDFKAGSTHMSAGHYTVTSPSPGIIQLQASDSNDMAALITHSVESLKETEKGKLVFHRYGSAYFLSQVWGPGQASGRELPTTRDERQIASTNKGLALAMVWAH